MRLFRRDTPEGEVVRTRATIERILVRSREEDDEKTVEHHLRVYLTFLIEPDLLIQEEFVLASGSVPFPGSSVEVAYTETKIDFNPKSVQPPPADVPRGWGAGIHDVPQLGGRSWDILGKYEMAQQHDTFKTGRRFEAEVLDVRPMTKQRRGARRYMLTLSNPGGEALEPRVWLPDSYVPKVGDRIQAAQGRDGSVAIDSDERFDGAPLQAPVFNSSAPVDVSEAEEHVVPLQVQVLELQLDSLKASKQFNPVGYEASVRRVLEHARDAGQISRDEYEHRLKDALS